MTLLLGAPTFLLMISLIVTIHELGHFSVARLFKTKIERFSVGFGPILWSRRDKNGVLWCLSALPLGGYVKFAGDEHVSSMSPDEKELQEARLAITQREGAGAEQAYFHFKPVWQRFLIVLAGPMANFVLAIAIFAFLLSVFGEVIRPPLVDRTEPGSVAEAAGFRTGDVLVSIDGRKVDQFQDAARLINTRADQATRFEVRRGAQIVTIDATPKRDVITQPGQPVVYGGRIGLHFADQPYRKRYWPHDAVAEGFKTTVDVLDTTLTYIGRIFTGKENGDQLSGILGMTKTTGDLTAEVAKAKTSPGITALNWALTMLQLAAVVSIGIGFVNLLPVPVLDGGHLVFYTYEAVARKPLNATIQGLGYRFGLVALLGLMLFATWNDLNRMGVSKFFGGLFS
ncbi:M50 family metallopeptidase [Asticcacaulis sp. BYS171W]|uniref:M50 family metallopeptidase n=1 Tax=Asticcacaulis aquaticus TaxID=2984212 RepID=A0ABT5HP72_9CAUL|nr:M50 family metallopeptidase [Asticcacaulis aquaticus]MDC7681857.1 M50 family metallopeptidase [Asticcacaulis aquaticus]